MPVMVHARREELVLLTEAAVAVALSVLLGNLRLVELPNGGSIALAVIPLLALAATRGVRVGVLAGCCAGLAQALSGGTIIHPAQLGLDYLLAYAALGTAGIAHGRGRSRALLSLSIVLAMSLHLLAMVASGVIFFATVAGPAALTYAIAYNAATVVPETLLALVLVPPLIRSIARANPADAWRRGLLPPPASVLRAPRAYRANDAAATIDTADVSRTSRLTRLPRRPRATPPEATAPNRTTLVRAAPFARRQLQR
jgi:thiamine transporter